MRAMATKGVDVSYWQKTIDWNKVKADGFVKMGGNKFIGISIGCSMCYPAIVELSVL